VRAVENRGSSALFGFELEEADFRDRGFYETWVQGLFKNP